MATKSTSSGGRSTRSSSSSSRPKSKANSGTKRASGTKSAATNRSTARKAPARKPAARKPASTASQNGSGNSRVVGTVKGAASKVSGPAIAIGATAVGVAGGLVLKGTQRRKTVLGIPVPRKVPSVDVKKLAKTVGKASKQFGETSKSVSKDIERVGDQAERIGKILG